MHCADSITDSLSDMGKLIKQRSDWGRAIGMDKGYQDCESLAEAIASSLDAVETISSCSTHLRNVVNDVLTLSKLDSNMLKIAPVAVSCERFLKDIYKMFSTEAKREEVEFTTHIDRSISQLNADWIVIDPGRVTQVSTHFHCADNEFY